MQITPHGESSEWAILANSRTWHIVAAILAASYGLVMAPWEIPFVQLTPDELEDPDIEMWLNRFRTLAYTCYAVALVAIANITQYLIRAPQLANSQEPIRELTEGPSPGDDQTTEAGNGQPP